MEDMLVRLYELPSLFKFEQVLKGSEIIVKRAIGPEKRAVSYWVEGNFSTAWASECEVAFGHTPISCFVAVHKGDLVGFSCYDTTMRGFFGPMGIANNQRGKGIGAALLIRTLHAMFEMGYGYAIIGGVGPADFYTKTVNAEKIKRSNPGVYRNLIS